jgi:hypothetical protein
LNLLFETFQACVDSLLYSFINYFEKKRLLDGWPGESNSYLSSRDVILQ